VRLADRLLMQASSCEYIIQAVCTVAGTYRLLYMTSGHDALTKENTHGKHASRVGCCWLPRWHVHTCSLFRSSPSTCALIVDHTAAYQVCAFRTSPGMGTAPWAVLGWCWSMFSSTPIVCD
jgi:hypothetical protein